LLGLLYEGRHLSLSVRRKITANVFYSTFTNVFYFWHVFKTFFKFFLGGNVFFINAWHDISTVGMACYPVRDS